MTFARYSSHCAGLLAIVLFTTPAMAADISVDYDQPQDRIRIEAQNASLTMVLAKVARVTGISIQIHPAVEKTVSFKLPAQSLQNALQKICRGLSYVIEYSTDAKQRTVVSGMKLLPEGNQDSGQLVPIETLNAQASQFGAADFGRGNQIDGMSDPRGGRVYPEYSQPGTTSKPKESIDQQLHTLSPDAITPADGQMAEHAQAGSAPGGTGQTNQPIHKAVVKNRIQPCTGPYCAGH